MPLNSGQINLLRLTSKGMEKGNGWAKVSKVVWPGLMHAQIPGELIETRQSEDGSGFARLTEAGQIVLRYS